MTTKKIISTIQLCHLLFKKKFHNPAQILRRCCQKNSNVIQFSSPYVYEKILQYLVKVCHQACPDV